MKQLLITGPREAEFREVPRPEVPPEGLLVRARLTAVSTGTELRVYRAVPVDAAGKFLHERVPFELPTTNGYSMVGEVVEVGGEVQGFAPGDRVFVPAPHGEYAAVDAAAAVKLPAEVSDEQAVLLSILEVAHIALRRGDPAPGENVAIVGQGVIGLSALAYCRAFGLRTAVVDREAARLRIARSMGADLAVCPDEADSVEQVLGLFHGQGADLVLEAASSWTAVETGMRLARTDGRLVVVSRHTELPRFNPVGHPWLGKRLSLLTSYGYPPPGSRWDRGRSIGLTLELLGRGRLDVGPLVTHRVGWEDLPDVYRRLDAGEAAMVGVVLRWNE